MRNHTSISELLAEAAAEADADPVAVPNEEAIAIAIRAGLLRAEDLAGADPVSAEEYEAAQIQAPGWDWFDT